MINDTQQTNQDVVRICLHNEVGTQSSEEGTKLCARVSELTGQEMDVGVYKWRRSQGTETGGGGGLRESWTGRGGTEDHGGGRGDRVCSSDNSINFVSASIRGHGKDWRRGWGC